MSLRIGFASVYAWRPHVEHLAYLARLAQQDGNEVFFLACDADLPACYTRELRDVRPGWMECLMCRAGGIRSYAAQGVTAIGEPPAADHPPVEAARAWSASSASTLGRFESQDDFSSAAFFAQRDRLAPASAKAYAAARNWIAREKLDAVCVFNGRVDATRAIFEAARDAGIHAITLERTWFGDGLQLLPDENCLGLAAIHDMVRAWKDRPLTEQQARRAASHLASRFLRRNLTEWRAYNTAARTGAWPVAGTARKVLVTPGSRNEIWGHADWQSGWPEPTAAYDAVIARLGLAPADLVLRCHPNWGEHIGRHTGERAESYFTQWARARGIHVITSTDPASTLELIAQSDAVLVGGGTAALDGAILGKQVIVTEPSFYQHAGFHDDAMSPQAVDRLRLRTPSETTTAAEREVARMALRFIYTVAHRVSQFTAHVQALSSSEYRYRDGADPRRFTELAATGRLRADDETSAANSMGEEAVLDILAAREWERLTDRDPAGPGERQWQPMRRRWAYRPVDELRKLRPVGDR
jgi:hypothetical protein